MLGTSLAHHKSSCFSITSARDRVLPTRCERSQIFTKNTLHVTAHSIRPVRLAYTVHRHTHRKHSDVAHARACTAEAMRRVAAARAHYRRSAQRDMRPQHPTVAPVRHPHTHARTHTLHGMQACRTRRPGMRAAAAAAAVMGAMVPPFKDMPGDEPRTSRRKRASGHSRGRPLHHARWNSHSTRGRPWRSSSPRRDPSEVGGVVALINNTFYPCLPSTFTPV